MNNDSPRELELFPDVARTVACAQRPEPAPLTEQRLQAELEGARQRPDRCNRVEELAVPDQPLRQLLACLLRHVIRESFREEQRDTPPVSKHYSSTGYRTDPPGGINTPIPKQRPSYSLVGADQWCRDEGRYRRRFDLLAEAETFRLSRSDFRSDPFARYRV